MSAAFSALILAAGASSRAEGPKALRQYRGTPWIAHVVRAWRRLGAARVAVVWNPAVAMDWMDDMDTMDGMDRVGVVLNRSVELGPLYSVQLGLRELGDAGTVAVSPVDVPPPSRAMMDSLMRESEGRAAVHPEFSGKGGHPLLMRAELFPQVLALDPVADRLDHFLKRAGALRLTVSDASVVLNLNDEDAWRRWFASNSEGHD